MGATCCKSKTEEGIEYDDNVYNDQYPHGVKQININASNLDEKNEAENESQNFENGISGMDYQSVSIQAAKGESKNGAKFDSNGFTMADSNYFEIFSKRLELQVKESKYGKLKEKIDLYALGLNNPSFRKQRLLFGIDKADCDYILPVEEGINNHHMEILSDNQTKEYYVRGICGSGVFIKITSPIYLKEGSVISFGTNHLLVSIYSKDDQQENVLMIKFKCLTGPNKGEE